MLTEHLSHLSLGGRGAAVAAAVAITRDMQRWGCWPGVGQVLARCWPGVGQVLAKCWPGVGRVLARCWPGVGQLDVTH